MSYFPDDNDDLPETPEPEEEGGEVYPTPNEDFGAYEARRASTLAARVPAASTPALPPPPAILSAEPPSLPTGRGTPGPSASVAPAASASASTTPPVLPRANGFVDTAPQDLSRPATSANNLVSLTDFQAAADRDRVNQDAAQAREADRLQRLDRTKAAVYGVGRGAAFLAGAPAGAGIGAELGSVFGPVGTAAGGLLGGLVSGTVAAWGADKGARLLAEHSDTVRGFTQAADAHPLAAGMGELVTGLSGIPRAATGAVGAGVRSLVGQGGGALARAGEAVAQGYEASGGGLADTLGTLTGTSRINVARGATPLQNAGAFLGETATRAATSAALDTAIKEGARSLGISDQGQTWDGAAMAGMLGAFTTQQGVRVGNYSNAETASLLARGRVREMAGADLQRGPLVPSQVPGYGHIPEPLRADFLRPFTATEAEAYQEAAGQIRTALARGQAMPRGTGVTVDQASRFGRPTGQVSVQIVPAGPASFRGN